MSSWTPAKKPRGRGPQPAQLRSPDRDRPHGPCRRCGSTFLAAGTLVGVDVSDGDHGGGIFNVIGALGYRTFERSKLVQVYAGAGIAKTARFNSKALDAAFPLRTLDIATLARQSRNMN